jgi:hypothetical protein
MLEQPTLKIGTLRLVCFALAGGLASFTVIAVALRTRGDFAPVQDAEPGLSLSVAISFASSVAVWFFLRKKFLAEFAKSKEEALRLLREDKVPHVVGTATIIGAALFEGPGLLGAVAILLGSPWYCLAAPVLGIMVIARMLPSRESIEDALRASSG